jgi:hypothetical protein
MQAKQEVVVYGALRGRAPMIAARESLTGERPGVDRLGDVALDHLAVVAI